MEKLSKPQINFNPQDLFNHIQHHFSTILNTTSLQHLIHNLSPLKNHHTPFASLTSTRNELQIKHPHHCFDLAMATEDIEERLSGVPVYALSNADEEFVLVSGVSSGRNLGLFCFNKDDADSLLEQMRSMDPGMRKSSKVVAVALNKVFQLRLNGVAFRFIPDSSQIKNAIKVNQSAGISDSGFSGVPVFQSQSLILKADKSRYRPIFFRKEDLENSLRKASHQQRKFNPALRQGDIQVSVLEEIIKSMKESSTSKWDDVIFIPPGVDLSTDLSQQGSVSANA